MKKSRAGQHFDLEKESHEHSIGLRRTAAQAFEESLKLTMGSDTDSDSDSDVVPNVDDMDKLPSDVDGESDQEDNMSVESEALETKEDSSELNEENIPKFLYGAMTSSENCPIPPELVNFFAVERDELLLQLQHDLLLKWFHNHTSASHTFPTVISRNLYRIVYSCDIVLSIKASETLIMLYKGFTTKDFIFWAPSFLELRQGLAFISHDKNRIAQVLPWCRMINAFFQAAIAKQFMMKNADSTSPVDTAKDSVTSAPTLSVGEIVSFWRELLIFSCDAPVVISGLKDAIIQAAQSVLRVACLTVWHQRHIVSDKPKNTQEKTEENSKLCLAVEAHKAIEFMCKIPDNVAKAALQPKKSKLYLNAVRKVQTMNDHCELISSFRNSDISCFIVPYSSHEAFLKLIQALNQCTLAVQMVSSEIYLLRNFGDSSIPSPDEEKFRQFLFQSDSGTIKTLHKFQPYKDVSIAAPSSSLLSLLEAIMSTEQNSIALFSSISLHYLRQCSGILRELSSAIQRRESVIKTDTTEKSRYSFDDNVELIYLFFKHINMIFNITLETTLTKNPHSKSCGLSSKRLRKDNELSALNNEDSMIKCNPNGSSFASIDQVETCTEDCSCLVNNINTFKTFLRKRKGAMGSTAEISHIIQSINDKWDFAKNTFDLA